MRMSCEGSVQPIVPGLTLLSVSCWPTRREMRRRVRESPPGSKGRFEGIHLCGSVSGFSGGAVRPTNTRTTSKEDERCDAHLRVPSSTVGIAARLRTVAVVPWPPSAASTWPPSAVSTWPAPAPAGRSPPRSSRTNSPSVARSPPAVGSPALGSGQPRQCPRCEGEQAASCGVNGKVHTRTCSAVPVISTWRSEAPGTNSCTLTRAPVCWRT